MIVIDATNNIKGVEHEMTRKVTADLAAGGVLLAGQAPYLVGSFGQLVDILGDDDLDWNALLLVSHGARKHAPGDADPVRFGEISAVGQTPGTWWLLNGAEMNVQDKAVFLAVCYGAGEDASEVALERQLALTLTGSRETLKKSEILAFFPPALIATAKEAELSAEAIAGVVEKHNALANGKMVTLMP